MMHWFSGRIRYWLTLAVLFALSFFVLQKLANYSFMRIDVSNSHSTYITVYWTTAEDPSWSESKTATLYAGQRKNHFVLPMPVALSRIKQLRIDPGFLADIRTKINELGFHSLYSESVHFETPEDFSRLEANQDIGGLKRKSGLAFESTGTNAQFQMDFPATGKQPVPELLIVQSILLALLMMSLKNRLPWLSGDLRWVPAGLLIAASSALAIATVSIVNTHPDEETHINNAQYYAHHYMPPQVCSQEARYTYTIYGISRLDKREIAYYAGGRYLQLLEFIPGPDYLKLRYFNVALLFILALLAFQRRRARFLFLPLLLTPQAWYLFAYYNSDALSMFAVALAAYQVFVPESMLRRLLNGERPPGWVFWVLGIALIVAMQYWIKLNFMFYPILLLMLVASWWLLNRRWPDRRHALPIVVAFVLGTSLFLSWEITRHAVNDFATAERMYDCQEITALKRFKPSTPLGELDSTIRLRDRGVSLREMLVNLDWARRTYSSALGAYGYTEYLSPDRHYLWACVLITLFFLYVILTISIRGDGLARLSVLSVLAAMAGLTMAAIINNWDQSFQTQGRYLLVYLPMLGTLIAMYAHLFTTRWLSLLAMGPFLLGLYSFYAVALVELPKG